MIIAAVMLSIIALAFNTFWVDSKTRSAEPRDGGRIIDTPVLAANAKVEGMGSAIVLLHGFGAAIDWWDYIASELGTDRRVIWPAILCAAGTPGRPQGSAAHGVRRHHERPTVPSRSGQARPGNIYRTPKEVVRKAASAIQK
jgi:hypothetical protein